RRGDPNFQSERRHARLARPANQCPLYPQKQTSLSTFVMSALCQKQAFRFHRTISGSKLKPVHGGGAEVREAVSRPQSAVSSETIAVIGPGGNLRVAPSLVGDAGKPR